MKLKNLSLKEVQTLAQKLAAGLGPKATSIGLVGPLGSGKTTFTKAFAKKLKAGSAKSPTFTVVNCYPAPSRTLYHIDLYRLSKSAELKVLGIEELRQEPGAVTLIEWADKFPKLLGQCDTIINFKISKDDKRDVTISHN